MDDAKAKKICDYVFKDVFGRENPFYLDEIKKRFAFDIPLPRKVKCALSGKDTWTLLGEGDKIASQQAIIDQFKKDEWAKKKRPIDSIKDIFKYWNEINYTTGEKYINSKNIVNSEGIYGSLDVYNSNSVFNSKNIVFCQNIDDCNYGVALRNNASCVLGIRTRESKNCSSGFEVSWSEKVSKCMYVHDCVDLYECLFCSHIRSRKYCITNMQFGKEEYFRIKKMVIDWVLEI